MSVECNIFESFLNLFATVKSKNTHQDKTILQLTSTITYNQIKYFGIL